MPTDVFEVAANVLAEYESDPLGPMPDHWKQEPEYILARHIRDNAPGDHKCPGDDCTRVECRQQAMIERLRELNCDEQRGRRRCTEIVKEQQAELEQMGERYACAVKDRADLLGVKSTDGLSSSEWVMRTATAEAENKRLREALTVPAAARACSFATREIDAFPAECLGGDRTGAPCVPCLARAARAPKPEKEKTDAN